MSVLTMPAQDADAGVERPPSSPVRRRGRLRRTRGARRWPTWLMVGGICGVALAARLHQIGSQSMWLDEAVSDAFAGHGVMAQWSWTHPLDTYHPPGYYSLLALWQIGGRSEAWLRAFSALTGALAVPFTFAATRRIAGSPAGYLAGLLLALSALQVRFGQETRTYSLLVLEAAVILWSLTWLLRYQRIAAAPLRGNPAARRWYAYVGAAGLALLSHNTAPLMWITANIAVLVHWRMTPHRSTAFLWAWARANLAVGAIWMVWFPAFVRQSLQTLEGGGHRTAPDGQALLVAWRDLSLGQSALQPNGRLIGDALAVGVVGAALVLAWRRRRVRRWAVSLSLFTVTAPLLAYGASVLGKPVFLTQSLMWVSVPFFLLVGVLAVQVPRPAALPLAGAVLAVTVAGLVAYYPAAHKEPWREAADYLRPRLRPGDLIVYSADYAMIPMRYYLHEPPGVTQIGTRYKPADLATVRRQLPDAPAVWLVYAHEEFADPDRWVAKVLAERGEQVERRRWSEEIELLRFQPRPPAGTAGPDPERPRS